MNVLLPMAGTGNRFVVKGYDDPKPLIKANGKPIIEYITGMFSTEDKIIFICNEDHINNTDMKQILQELHTNSQIDVVAPHKLGPIYTIMNSLDQIHDDEPVIISYCDNPLVWDYTHFKEYVTEHNLDGCILTHSGFHPHTLNNTKMAFLKVDGIHMTEIKEKECYTDNPMSEHASTGVYYFKSGSILKKYCKLAIENELTYNGEYYVTLMYNLLVKDDLKVGWYDTDYALVFGTPEELESFHSWVNIISAGQIQDPTDLTKCYDYWKSYLENN
tara:strand:+ start:6535 stop:7356 length:822 start_codon:yes stop_codon:yes gene_type:complete